MRHGSDLRLVTRVIAGEESATADFVARVECIRRFLAQRVRTRGAPTEHDLDDLAQATFSELWQKLDTYRGDASLETWACSFARLELLRAWTRAARRRERAQVELDTSAADSDHLPHREPTRRALGAEISDPALAELLSSLTASCARVIGLRHVDGLTFDEIAQQLAASTSKVKSTYYRGLERLRARAPAR
jgi:RNA polymerase sigma-70 factor (ECF subfamily)